METNNNSMTLYRYIVTVIILMTSIVVSAQSNGDRLFMEGQAFQQKQTIVSQNQAIKKFRAAKVVYTSADKKKMCDNQIAICYSNISSLRKGTQKGNKEKIQIVSVHEPNLSLSQSTICFDGDKKGTATITVDAPSEKWEFKTSDGIDGESNFVKATKSVDSKSLNIEVDANPYTIKRHQSVIALYQNIADTLLVEQRGKDVTLTTNENLLEFKLKGGEKSLEIYTNSDSIVNSNNGLTWYVASKPDWIVVSVEVKKEKSVFKKFFEDVGDTFSSLVEDTPTAATASDTKTSKLKIIARTLPKNDPGRIGEIHFVSQDKTCKITVVQQK